MKKIFAVIGMYCALVMPVLAVEEVDVTQTEDTSENVVITGKISEKEVYSLANYAQPLKSSGASVDVITLEDIKAQDSPVLTDLLGQFASLTTQTNNGSMGAVTTVRMRGTDRVRFTIDGVRADRPSLTASTFEPQFIMSDDIERMEIVRGMQGDIGGTNSSGGLVALQTRRGRGPFKMELESGMGGIGSFKERVAVMSGDEKKDYYLGLTWFKTNGGLRTSNFGTIDNDDYNNLSLVSNIGVRVLDNKAEIRDIFRFSRARKGIGIGSDAMGEPCLDSKSYGKNLDVMNVLSFDHNPTNSYNYNVKFGLYHNESDNNIFPNSLGGDYSYSTIASTRLNFITQHNLKYKDWNTLSLGYNMEGEFIDSNSNMLNWGFASQDKFTGSTLQNDIFVSDLVNIKDKLFIRGGARLINHSDYGTFVTPNASAALVLPTFKIAGAKTKFRGSWGQSVNMPTLYQRYGRANFGWDTLVPNPSLRPETATGWDVGVEQSFFDEKLALDFGYFNSEYKDYIFYKYSYPASKYDNMSGANVNGYEARLTYTPNTKFKLVANYTYTNSEDTSTGFELPGCPKNRINTTLYWTPIERFTAFVGVESATERVIRENVKTPSYIDVKLGAKVRLFTIKNTNVYFKTVVYNLLNQNICMYKDYSNNRYLAPGINFMAGLFINYNLPEKEKI